MSSSTALATLVPAIRQSARKAFASISSIRARQAVGTHIFRIDGYSTVDEVIPAGTSISSGKFLAGGHKWKLNYFPNGLETSDTRSIFLRDYYGTLDTSKPKPAVSVELSMEDGCDFSSAMARFLVSILDRAGVPAYSAAVKPSLYKKSMYSRSSNESAELVTVEELRESMRWVVDDQDCLNVHSEVSVLKLDSESETRWYIRQALARLY